MSELLQDLQTTTTTFDLLRLLLTVAEANGKAVSNIFSRTGESLDTLSRQYDEEARVLRDFIKHMERGHEVKSVEVLNNDQADLMMQLLKTEGIPFVGNKTENGMLFMYKDIDGDRFMAVAKEAERYVQDRGHEMSYAEFKEKVGTQQDFAKVEGLTEEEIAVFRREADKQSSAFIFAVKENINGSFDVYADKNDVLKKTVTDTLFVMGTTQGQKYAKELVPFDKDRDDFVKKATEMSMGILPAYIIDAKNPTHIIELSGGKYKTHGLRVDSEGKMVDSVTKFSKDISHDIYSEMNSLKMTAPVMLSSAEASTFIKGISRDGTLEFDARYNGSLEKFIGLSDILEKNHLGKNPEPPIHEPQLEVISMSQDFRDKASQMTVYQNIPLPTLLKIEKAEIQGVYTYNKGNVREVACTPEAAAQVSAIMKESLAKDKGPLDTWLTMEKYKGHGEPGENKDEVYYIVDASFPDACLEISPQDVTYSDTEIVQKLEIPEGVSRDNAILAQVHQMGAPIILSKEEYELMIEEGFTEKQQIIESRHMNPTLSNVIQAEQERLDTERDNLDKLLDSPQKQRLREKEITPAQQYVMKQYEKRDLSVQEQEMIKSKEFNPDKHKEAKSKENVEPER